MTTCLIDLCGEKGLEGFNLLRPLFYHLMVSDRFHYIPAAGITSASAAVERLLGEKPIDRMIFFIDTGKGRGVLSQSLFLKMSELAEKILVLRHEKLNAENCTVVVLDTVDRDDFSGCPTDKHDQTIWELDFSGWLKTHSEELPFVFVEEDFAKFKSAWGGEFNVSAGQIINVNKESLNNDDKKKLDEKIRCLRECCAALYKEKITRFERYNLTYCQESYVEEIRSKIDKVFEGFESDLLNLDRMTIEDGYGHCDFRPENLLREFVQNVWSVNSQSDSMNLLFFKLPMASQSYHCRMVELGFLSLALAEGRFEECLKNCQHRLFNVDVEIKTDRYGQKIAGYIHGLSCEIKRLQKELSTGHLSGSVPTYQVAEFASLRGVEPFKPQSYSLGFFNKTGDYAKFGEWTGGLMGNYDHYVKESRDQLNECMDKIHEKIAQEPDRVPCDNLELECDKRRREFDEKQKQHGTEHAHIPDQRQELTGNMDVARNKFLKLSDMRPTFKPMFISLLGAMGMFAMAYLAGGSMVTPANQMFLRFTVVILSVCAVFITCTVILLMRYRKRLLDLADRFKRDLIMATHTISGALSKSHGILKARYEMSLARRNFEEADKVFQEKAEQRGLQRHHRDNLESHKQIAEKLLKPFLSNVQSTNTASQELMVETIDEPAFRNSVYWPMGGSALVDMVCVVDDHSVTHPQARLPLCSINLRPLKWQPH